MAATCSQDHISTVLFPGPHRTKGLHWVFKGTASLPDVTVRPTTLLVIVGKVWGEPSWGLC